MKDELLKLDNQLCFALYASSKEVTRLYKPYLDKLNLTYTQYITLLVLWEKDNITVKELGSKLYLDSGTLTPLLKKLESMDIVQRTRDIKDERNVYISLTEKGKDLKNRAMEIPERIFCGTGLSMEEAVMLKDNLKVLINKLVQP